MRLPLEYLEPMRRKIQPPLGIVLGSPREVADLLQVIGVGNAVCYQMDLFPAARLREEIANRGLKAEVRAGADLWDLPAEFRTLIYPAPQKGERALKLDMIEQAFHVLKPQGGLIVLSPYEHDPFFPAALKKVFKKVHMPAGEGGTLLWCHRQGERPRRRHEVTYQVRGENGPSLRFLSRPGVFCHGRLDDGARALIESMHIQRGERVLDLGCGLGANGVFAALRGGPDTFVCFVDSNLRAMALAEHNARALGLRNFETRATCDLADLPARSFDVVLANPPYFAQGAIAHAFVEHGRRVLRPGGRFYLVIRQPEPVVLFVEEFFGPPEIDMRRGYYVLCGHVSADRTNQPTRVQP
jgi:16S rRNA G1207 methylase RsmC